VAIATLGAQVAHGTAVIDNWGGAASMFVIIAPLARGIVAMVTARVVATALGLREATRMTRVLRIVVHPAWPALIAIATRIALSVPAAVPVSVPPIVASSAAFILAMTIAISRSCPFHLSCLLKEKINQFPDLFFFLIIYPQKKLGNQIPHQFPTFHSKAPNESTRRSKPYSNRT
jgi:hypothetical protein